MYARKDASCRLRPMVDTIWPELPRDGLFCVEAVMPPPAAWIKNVVTSMMTKNLTSAVTGKTRQFFVTSWPR